jgi:hypothetical protein
VELTLQRKSQEAILRRGKKQNQDRNAFTEKISGSQA